MKHASKRHSLRHEETGRFVSRDDGEGADPIHGPWNRNTQYQVPADEREAWPHLQVDRDGRLGADGFVNRPGFKPCSERGRR